MSELKTSREREPRAATPWFTLLWCGLALAYVIATALGERVLALALVGIMTGALFAVSGRRVAGAVIGVGLPAACLAWPESLFVLVYLPPMAAFAFMAWFFGRTLRRDSVALITRVARLEHPELPADLQRYTRALTWLWTIAFAALFATAALLAPAIPLPLWSRWVHGLGYAVPAALFLGEYAWRHYRYREHQHGSLATLVANIVIVSRSAFAPPQPAEGERR